MKRILAGLLLLLALAASGAQAQNKTTPDNISGGVYNQILPTLSNLQPGVLQVDQNGRLIIDLGAGSISNTTFGASQNGNWNVGGYDSGTSPVQSATPANASHTAGQSVGGLFSIPLARTNGGSGLLTQINITSVAGDTPTLQVRLWDRAPTNSNFACADNSAYAAGSGSTGGTVGADQAHLLTPPFSVTLAAPTSVTGDAYTYGSYSFSPPLSFKNQDGTTTKNVYACLQATTTYTPGVGAYYVDAIGPQD